MPCASTHRLINFGATAAFLCTYPRKQGEPELPHPAVAAPLSALLATLPDILEPALKNPNHRQFFHSIIFAALLGRCVYDIYRWTPETELDRLVRGLLLVGGTAYLLHLAADAFTKRSLPLLGR